MKYKYLSAAVIICTALSVTAMLISESSNIGVEEKNGVETIQDANTKDKGQSNNTSVQKASGETSNTKNQTVSEKPKETVSQQSTVSSSSAKTSEETKYGVIEAVINEREINRTEALNNTQYPSEAAVFKVEADKIQDELSLLDKVKLIGIASKISPVDYARISNYLEDGNYSRGIINTFSLLKQRLSNNDYDKVKDVASKYIDVNCVENYIK